MTLLRTEACSLPSFRSKGGKYVVRSACSLLSSARAILISTFPQSSSSRASVAADMLMLGLEEVGEISHHGSRFEEG